MSYPTTIWVRTGILKAKPIWKGDLPHVLRAGDDIVINPDRSIERVETATFDLTSGEVEARIAGEGAYDEYPAIGEGI